MAGFEVRCGFCGNVFVTAEETVGQAVTCPGCQRQVSVPAPEEPGVERPRLTVKRETAPGGMPVCPSCNAAMPENAILCVKCGYDMRTGTRYQPRVSTPNLLRIVMTGVGIVILAGLVRTYLQRRAASEQAPPAPAVAGEPAEEAGPAGEAPAPAPAETVAPAAAAPVVEAAPAVPTQEVAAAAAPVDEAMLRAYEEGLRKWLAQTYPPYKPGDEAVLRRANGRVHRGKIFEMGADRVSLLQEGARDEIPFALLDQASRLRCDKVFRQRWVDFQVKRRAGASGTAANP